MNEEAMSMNLSVAPRAMTDWNEAAWDTFIFSLSTTESNPERCWAFWVAICKNFKKFSIGCQSKALVAADRLILQIRENMEQAMAALQDTYQDAYIPKDLLEINLYEGGDEDETEEN